MKTIKKISVLLLAVVLCMSIATAAFAEGESYTKAGATTSFNQYLVMKTDANVPNVTFAYTITPGTAIPASTGKFEVLAGVGTPTVGTAEFTVSDTKLTTKADGDTVTLDSGEAYVKKSVTIDFSGVTFDEPGVYRYILTATETSGALGMTYDTQKSTDATEKVRTVDVYVTDVDGALEVTSYVIHDKTDAPVTNTTAGTADVATEGGKIADKSDGFVNEYATQNLGIAKTVTGNQGSKNKYFKFTVEISGAVAGTKYDVDISQADATSGTNSATVSDNAGKANVTELVVGTDGTVTANFYLHHDQAIIIKGLAQGTNYAVTEEAEDYKSTSGSSKVAVAAHGAVGDDDYVAAKTYNGAANGTIASADVYTGYTNTREGTVPTGVNMSIIPGMLIVFAAIGALLLIGRKKQIG